MLSARMTHSNVLADDPSGSLHGASALPFKTPARATSSAHPFTVLRTNLKENAHGRPTVLKTLSKKPGTNHNSRIPGTPGFKFTTAGTNSLKINDNVNPNLKNTSKMPRLLDLFGGEGEEDGTAEATPLKKPQINASNGGPTVHFGTVPETIIRPSRMRTSLRLPKSASKNPSPSQFKTPAPDGRRHHWEISDGEISIQEAGPVMDEGDADTEEWDDEVEYMPPPVVELPWEPDFDVPDFTALGAGLMSFRNTSAYSNLPYDPTIHDNFEFDSSLLTTNDDVHLDLPVLEADDDDPFLPFKKRKAAQSKAQSSTAVEPASAAASSKAMPPPTQRVTRSSSRVVSSSQSKSTSASSLVSKRAPSTRSSKATTTPAPPSARSSTSSRSQKKVASKPVEEEDDEEEDLVVPELMVPLETNIWEEAGDIVFSA